MTHLNISEREYKSGCLPSIVVGSTSRPVVAALQRKIVERSADRTSSPKSHHSLPARHVAGSTGPGSVWTGPDRVREMTSSGGKTYLIDMESLFDSKIGKGLIPSGACDCDCVL